MDSRPQEIRVVFRATARRATKASRRKSPVGPTRRRGKLQWNRFEFPVLMVPLSWKGCFAPVRIEGPSSAHLTH